ncbi:hypothetical protein QL285_084466 [Trifolium repens]|nr:hypothetical protein QL285_084466 [Trifolium repens]
MAMLPRSAASLIPDHDDSVENEKDSGPSPQKKLKVEEDNSSVPISQDSVENANEKDFPPPPQKLKGEEEEEDNSSDLDDIEAKTAFDRWCKLFLQEYPNKSVTKMRFQHFKKSFNRDVDPTMLQCGFNAPQYADRSEKEFFSLTNGGAGLYCYIDNELLNDLEEYKSAIEEGTNF